MQKAIRMLGITVAISLLAFIIGMVSAQDEGKVLVTGISMVGGDLETIDPNMSEVSSSIEIVNQVFVGLTAQDVTTGNPALERRWTSWLGGRRENRQAIATG